MAGLQAIPKRPALMLPLLLVLLLSLASPAAAYTRFAEDSCDVIGDSDVYGIGVRIGYYFAYFACIVSLIAGNPRAASDSVKAVLVIALAILVVLIRNTMSGSLAAFEWYLVSQMMFLILGGAGYTLFQSRSRAAVGCLMIIYGVYLAVQPWPFFTLQGQGRRDGCELKAFIFAPFDFYNYHFVTFLKVMSVIGAIGSCTFLIGGIAMLIWAMTEADGKEDDDFEIGTLGGAGLIGGLIGGSFGIAFTEKLLAVNSVDLSEATLNDTSQLIPFLVGLFTFMSTIWSIIHDFATR